MSRLNLAVALDGTGWHPAAWRESGAQPSQIFKARYWVDLAREAERAGVDFLTLEDAPGLQSAAFDRPDARTDQLRGRLDASLLAARLAPATSRIGLVPTTNVTHTEPFHTATGIATLDYTSRGRAGWRPQVSARAADASHFGRRTTPALRPEDVTEPEMISARLAGLHLEAADVVEVVRRLWDSWEDGAEIRDVATGRFLDRTRLHYVDFVGTHFSVRGPSITPRPPQGQPPVTILAHATGPYRLAASMADVVYVTPRSTVGVTSILREVDDAERAVGRMERPLLRFADLVVFLDDAPGAADRRKRRLDERDGAPLTSDAAIVCATPSELADLMVDWAGAGLDGFRLRPGALPHDLETISRSVVPELVRRGVFDPATEASTLRGLLGLPRPVNRYEVPFGEAGISADPRDAPIG